MYSRTHLAWPLARLPPARCRNTCMTTQPRSLPPISPVTPSSPSLLWEPQKYLPTLHTQQNIKTIKKKKEEMHAFFFCAALNLWELPATRAIMPPKEMLQVRVGARQLSRNTCMQTSALLIAGQDSTDGGVLGGKEKAGDCTKKCNCMPKASQQLSWR